MKNYLLDIHDKNSSMFSIIQNKALLKYGQSKKSRGQHSRIYSQNRKTKLLPNLTNTVKFEEDNMSAKTKIQENRIVKFVEL